jgi:hypothetical protein
MRNNTGEALHFSFGEPGADYQLSVNEEGRSMRFGDETFLKRGHERGSDVDHAEVTLKPHETYRTKIDLSPIFQPMDKPRKYSVEMQMKLPPELGPGLVRSNTVTVTVSE